jgi:hypothetical protein
MLKIRALKIEVNTSSGLFGGEYNFTNGLNIIRGDNSTGKSTLFQSILYGLGFEELLGGKNEKTMQSTLKDQVEFPKDVFHNVLQSFVFIEIENNDIITIKRSVVAGHRKAQLVDVFFGGILTNKTTEVESRQMYIHDSGAASDADYGFHVFLSQFLGWELPEIMTSKGDFHKLYLQQLAPAFIIEQKSGWSDFFATMPYFGMRNTEQRVIEFLLNLDVFENEKRKQEINYQKQELINNWQKIFSEFQGLAGRVGGKIEGINNHPVIVNLFDSVYISIIKDGQYLKFNDFNEAQKNVLASMEARTSTTVGSNVEKNEQELKRLTNELNQLSLNFDLLSPELSFDRAKLNQYDRQVKSVQDDLRKNKSALKLNKLGGDLPTEIADNVCPTCEQEISGSLLPVDIEQVSMRLEDNIAYLDAQERMILVYIEGQKDTIDEKEKTLVRFQASMTELRQKIRSIKQELLQDERLPSLVEIEKRIDLRRKVELFNKVGDLFSSLLDRLKVLSDEYELILNSESNLSKDFLSSDDRKKLADLQSKFIHLLRTFNYQSKPFNAIQISHDSYVPVAQKLVGEHMYYNIKFDSSASDFIRCIWAYTSAMMQTAKLFNTNHPRLVMLDEPKQQDISMDNFRSFLAELSKFETEQVLLFASFENSDDAFEVATHGLKFNLIKIGQKLIRPINDN